MRANEPAAMPVEEVAGATRSKNPKRRLLLRRLLAVMIIAAVVAALSYVVFRTELLAPVLAIVPPVQEFIAWCIEDPARAWSAAGVVFMSNLGLYAFVEERLR